MNKYTREWVQKAEADVIAATKLSKARPRLNDTVCFLCQQAAEKYLKAFLQELGLPVPRTHDLGELLLLLIPHEPAMRPLRRGVKGLTRYAVEYRYPGFRATARQAQSALRQAGRARSEVRKRLGFDKPWKRRKPTP
jgi:HEPN domain-containing protein